MTELEKIAVTALFTIVCGVVLFVIGQLFSKLLIEPVQALRHAIGEVRFNLAFHAPVIHTPAGRTTERSQKARDALMKSSCDLLAKLHAVTLYSPISWLSMRILPKQQSIQEAAKQLRGLSTYVNETGKEAVDNLEIIRSRVNCIEKLLYLKPFE
ncbi:MAG: hypothetical protein ABIJ24_01920 [Nitrospinota bacterium]